MYFIIFYNIFAGFVPGLQQIWILGDDLPSCTYETNFARVKPEGYAISNYEVQDFSNNKFTTINPNMISRIRNLMAQAIKEQVLLPKFIVIVPDDDIIKYVNFSNFGVSEAYGRLINHIMVEHNRLLETQMEFLPEEIKVITPSSNHLDYSTISLQFCKQLITSKIE